jgi:hypothetical protein
VMNTFMIENSFDNNICTRRLVYFEKIIYYTKLILRHCWSIRPAHQLHSKNCKSNTEKAPWPLHRSAAPPAFELA